MDPIFVPIISPNTINSTRRFCGRPSALLFEGLLYIGMLTVDDSEYWSKLIKQVSGAPFVKSRTRTSSRLSSNSMPSHSSSSKRVQAQPQQRAQAQPQQRPEPEEKRK